MILESAGAAGFRKHSKHKLCGQFRQFLKLWLKKQKFKMEDDKKTRATRLSYRKLLEKVHKPGASADPREIMDEANILLETIKRPQEAVLDVMLLTSVTRKLRDNIDQQNGSSNPFQVNDFATRLMGKYYRDDGTKPTRRDMTDLGSKVRSRFQKVPSFHFMLGVLDKEVSAAVRSPEKRKRTSMKNKPELLVATKFTVQTAETAKELKKGSTISEQVETAKKALMKAYKANGRKNVNFFEFVIHPQSFSASIRNMFLASFLVKERSATISRENGIPLMGPLKGTLRNADDADEARSDQVIMSITKRQWTELIDVLDLKEPMINLEVPSSDLPPDDDSS
jgi:hypothetical protein